MLIMMPVSLCLDISECNNSLFPMTQLCVIFLHYDSFIVFTARALATKGALVRHHSWRHFDNHAVLENCFLLKLCWWSYCMIERDWSPETMLCIEDLLSSSSHFCICGKDAV